MNVIKLVVLLAIVIGGGYYGYQWQAANRGVAVAAPVRFAVEEPTDRFPAASLDVREHGRGLAVPADALRGFAVPEGFELPDDPDLLPNSARDYRGGYHEGIDFPLAFDMPAVAAKAGKIVRIDSSYVEWSVAEQIAGEDVGFKLGYTPETILDKLRGRQVWIESDHGVITRYAHLKSVELLSVGEYVAQGQLIGRVGNSGTKAGPHLHIEIRIGDSYLGDGLSGDQLLRVLRRAFDR